MLSRVFTVGSAVALAVLLPLGIVGCPSAQGTGLPGSVTIVLPDGTSVEAERGSGAPSLANSQWQFFQVEGLAGAFVTVNFGPDGNLESFEDNTIASGIFGDSIIFDGQRHSTRQQGVQYAAATYGAETADAGGFAFVGRLSAFFSGVKVASGTATATATFDPNDPDTVFGTFTFSTRVTISSVPGGNVDDEFEFIGRRVIE